MGIMLYDTSNVEKGGKVEEWLGKVFNGRRDEV
jgi:aryl-alcohol dehydrogenase-like predicted oxidoreductase